MSLGQVASAQPASAPPMSAPPAASPPAAAAPASAPAGSEPAAPNTGLNTGLGSNSEAAGGPDWRAMLAGEDTKALELVSRYKSPTEVSKALMEAQGKLRQRAEPVRLSDTSTPEQISEYRRAMGIPDLAADAAPEKLFEAYGIKAPEGYELSPIEKGMLGEFAKHANSKHLPPAAVKEATDFFLKGQAANQQAVMKLDIGKQKEWQAELRDELGRDFEPTIAAGESFLNQHFADKPEAKDELLNARLPGGGKLGDNPAFIRLVTDLAVKNGFTDRIEASSLESGGKSLQAQQMELEGLMHTDRARYNLPETQARLDKIIGLRMSRGEIDEQGIEVKRRRA